MVDPNQCLATLHIWQHFGQKLSFCCHLFVKNVEDVKRLHPSLSKINALKQSIREPPIVYKYATHSY